MPRTVDNARLQAMLGADQGPAPHIPQPKPTREPDGLGSPHLAASIAVLIIFGAGVYVLGVLFSLMWEWLK